MQVTEALASSPLPLEPRPEVPGTLSGACGAWSPGAALEGFFRFTPGDPGHGLGDVRYTAPKVPEAAAMVLVGTGVAAACLRRRRKMLRPTARRIFRPRSPQRTAER